jgi:hypothetical protein
VFLGDYGLAGACAKFPRAGSFLAWGEWCWHGREYNIIRAQT